MRIRSIQVRELGPWRELRLGLDPVCQVFYGPNEVGKSTLLRFIRETLFPRRESVGENGPIKDQPGDGVLDVETADGNRRIARSVSVDRGDAATIPAARRATDSAVADVSNAAHGIDGDTYARVFAIGLREVQELATLGNRESARELYELSCGVDGKQLASLQAQLARARRTYWNPAGSGHEVGRLRKESRRWKRQLASVQASAGTAADAERRHQECLAELDRLEAERRNTHSALAALEQSESIQEKLARRDVIDSRLTALGPQADLPSDIAARGDASVKRVRSARLDWRRWKGRHAKARAAWKRRGAIGKAPLNPNFVQDIERQLGLLSAREADLQRLRAELTAMSSSGPPKDSQTNTRDGAKNAPETVPPRLRRRDIQRLRVRGRSLIDARRAFQEARDELGNQPETTQPLDPGPNHGSPDSPSEFAERQLRELGERVTALRRLVQAEERRDELERHRAQLEERLSRVRESDLQPIWSVAGLGLLFILGVGASLLGVGKLALPTLFFGSAYAWQLAIGGIIAASISVLWKWYGDHRVDAELETIEQRTAVFENQMAQAERELEHLREEFGGEEEDPHELLETAETELAELEGRLPRQVAPAKAPPSAVPSRLADLEGEYRRARRRWHGALRRFRLPDSFRPRDLEPLVRRLKEDRRATGKASQIRQSIDVAEQDLMQIKERVRRALEEAQLKSEYANPNALLTAVRGEVEIRNAAERGQLELKGRAARTWRRLKKARGRLRAARRQQRRLFALAGAWDETHFQQIMERRAEVETLRNERDALTRDMESSLAAYGRGVDLRASLAKTSAANTRDERARLIEQLRGLDAAVREKSAESERVRQERFARDNPLENARARLRGDLAARRLRGAKNEWRARALLETVLHQTARRLEADHQPLLLQKASPYFERLTRGRYTRVLARLGDRSLYVQESDGKQYDVESLSDGAREQLYLCLRLALMASFAEKGVRLPVVLDDVFVNYDDSRAQAAAELLLTFARDTNLQAIVFTCHRHLSRMFAELGAQVDALPSESESDGFAFPRPASLGPPAPLEITASPARDEEETPAVPMPIVPDTTEQVSEAGMDAGSTADVEPVPSRAEVGNSDVEPEEHSGQSYLDGLPLTPWTSGNGSVPEDVGTPGRIGESWLDANSPSEVPAHQPQGAEAAGGDTRDQSLPGTPWEELSDWSWELEPATASD